MRAIAIIALSCSAGCFAPDYGNGELLCASDGTCPEGYHCASDRACWRDGTGPGGGDLAAADGGSDLSQSPDLDQPSDLAPIVFPPAAVWISSGGGSGIGTGPGAAGWQGNLSLGGTDQVGSLTSGPGGASCTFGYFASGTY
jgi:hypothetical protein